MPTHDDTSGRPSPARRGRRATFSLEQVLDASIGLLDEKGAQALTFRALAGRLDTGVGSIYHYVASKDDLLDRATDAILAGVLGSLQLPEGPFAALRALSDTLYLALQEHPWVGNYLMRNTALQPHSLRLFELFGQQVLPLDLTPRQQFDAVSSLVSFVIGTGAEMRELPEAISGGQRSQRDYLREFADSWRALDAEDYPFVHAIADEFEQHDDFAQFRAGVDLILSGIEAGQGRGDEADAVS